VNFVVSSEVQSQRSPESFRGEARLSNPVSNLSITSRDPSDSAEDDVATLEPAEPRIRKIIAWAIRGPARWVYFSVGLHGYRASVGFAAAISQIADEFLTCVELRACRLVAVEITYETNAERNIVQIIAVHMAAVDLAAPAIAHFDLAVAR
jgi:hypothetical protein